MYENFSKKLCKLIYLNNKTQMDLINDLGFSSSTVSSWCNGLRVPRMDKMKILANYFNVPLNFFFDEDTTTKSNTYITDNETKLISSYRKLNKQGKEKATERVEELTEIKRYTTDYIQKTKEDSDLIVEFKKNDNIPSERLLTYKNILNAAHERTDIEVTEEMKKHDENIMDDENF